MRHGGRLRPAATANGRVFIHRGVAVAGGRWRIRHFSTALKEYIMLYWAIVFLLVAFVAGVLGFTGMAGAAASIAKILFVVFLVLFVVSLIFGRRRSP